MRSFLAILILCLSSSALADVAFVNIYEPLPGGAALTNQYMQEAREIQQAMGAQVVLSSDLKGIFNYVLLFDNWEAYGAFVQSLQGNADWRAFNEKIAETPSARQIDNLLLDEVAAPAEPVEEAVAGAVSQITVWEPTTGVMADLIQGALGAKPIHEKAGAKVWVYVGGGRLHYLQQFENMEAWGKHRDTPNPEFDAYMQSRGAGTSGGLGAVIVDQSITIDF